MRHTIGRRRRLPGAATASLVALVALLGFAGCGGDAEGGEIASADGDTTTEPSDGGSGEGADGGSGGSEGEPSEEDQLLAFAQCMRDNGIDMPDPVGDQGLMAAMQSVVGEYGREEISDAFEACEEFAPTEVQERPDEMDPEQQLALAECLREQGIDVPDNLFEGGLPEGIEREDLMAAMDECRDVLDAGSDTGADEEADT